MKNQSIALPFLSILAAAVVLSGCSKSPDVELTPVKSTPKPVLAADPNLPEVKVTITASDQMKFDVNTIQAKPGQKVSVTLVNGGTIPKVSMGHNFVLFELGVDMAKFVEASQMQMANEYIAPEFKDKVIAHTKLLGPKESETITFAAPRAPGSYPYICSFPGHYTIGMKGNLVVQ